MKRAGLMAIILTAMMIFAFPSLTSAHSALVSSSPEKTSTTEVAELKLTYNEEIEPVSKVTVTNASGDKQAIKKIKVDDKVMIASFENPLTNGLYTVDWRIISADGHPLEGSYALEVKIPDPITTPSPSPESIASEQSSPSASAVETTAAPSAAASPSASTPAVQETTETEQSESSSGNKLDSSNWILIAAGAFLVVAIVSVVFNKRRKL